MKDFVIETEIDNRDDAHKIQLIAPQKCLESVYK